MNTDNDYSISLNVDEESLSCLNKNERIHHEGQNKNDFIFDDSKNEDMDISDGNRRDSKSKVSLPLLEGDNSLYGNCSNNNGWENNNVREASDLDYYHKTSNESDTSFINEQHRITLNDSENFDELFVKQSKKNESKCGFFKCRPKWARRFASTHMFMVVFLLAWILQGMYLTYFVSCITTIEKLFQIKSKTTGMLMSASEIGQISTAMLLTYFAGRGHRPKWIGVGMVIFAIASFSCSLPHFIFGKQLIESTDFSLSKNKLQSHNFPNKTLNSSLLLIDQNMNLCTESNDTSKLDKQEECEDDIKQEQASHSEITHIVLYIFFASLLSSGVGQTAVSTLGIPYIDDNVASKESPIYLAITIGVRILGPATGFVVGSFCARIYVDLSNPDIDPTDPKWISAWWLGPVVIGCLMLLASIAMFSFPKQLKTKNTSTKRQINESEMKFEVQRAENLRPRLKDFPKTIRRQFSNDILMFRAASSVLHILPIAGLYTFLPKYLETQFRLQTADAALISAFGGILVMGLGIVISGIVILKFNPSARSVAAWIAFTAFVYSCGMIILMFVGCDMSDFADLSNYNSQISPNFEVKCNKTCICDINKFEPVCGVDNQIYFSSCHAGCSVAQKREDGRIMFSNCECIPEIPVKEESYTAISGYCDNSCKSFILFLCLFAFFVFMHSTSEVGSMLLIMRCTDPKDKAMAMGVIQSAIGLFGNVPCPIIYGAIVDSACLVWKTVCGKPGACSLYDITVFRHYFLGVTGGIMLLAFFADIVVWKKAYRIDITPNEPDEKKNKHNKPNQLSESAM